MSSDATPALEPAVAAAVNDAAHSVDLFSLISRPRNPEAWMSIMQGLGGFNQNSLEFGLRASLLILERALLTAFIERKMAHEDNFRCDLREFIARVGQIPAILFNVPGAPVPETSENAKATLFYACLGLMLSLRPEATDKALETIYLRLVEAAIAAHKPCSEDIENEVEMAEVLKYTLSYIDVLNKSEESEVALSSEAELSASIQKHFEDTIQAVKSIIKALEQEHAAQAADRR
ncbi:hypothetical protein EV122DRAFT_226686 [Schizophyllum commune]